MSGRAQAACRAAAALLAVAAIAAVAPAVAAPTDLASDGAPGGSTGPVSDPVPVPDAAPPDSPGAACSVVAGDVPADERRVVALPTSGDRPLSGTVSLYSGSRLDVVVCEGDGTVVPTGGGDIWRLENGTGFRQIAVQQNAWTVALTGAGATVDLPSLVAGRSVSSGLRVRVRPAVSVNSTLVGGTIPMPNRTAAERFRAAERRFENATARINRTAVRLNESAAFHDASGMSGAAERRFRENLTALEGARARVRESGERVQTMLYAAAADGYLTPGQASAITTVERRQARALGQSRGAVERYLTRTRFEIDSLRSNAVFLLGTSALAGVLVGLGAGAFVAFGTAGRRAVAGTCLVGLLLLAAGVAVGLRIGVWEVVL